MGFSLLGLFVGLMSNNIQTVADFAIPASRLGAILINLRNGGIIRFVVISAPILEIS